MHYIAIVYKDDDSGYGVAFPDLPGCFSAGDTLEETRENAAEALALHLEGLADDGIAPPTPSSLDIVLHHPDYTESKALIAIPCPDIKEKAVRVQITATPTALAKIDAAAAAAGKTRSAYLVGRAVGEDPA